MRKLALLFVVVLSFASLLGCQKTAPSGADGGPGASAPTANRSGPSGRRRRPEEGEVSRRIAVNFSHSGTNGQKP